MSIKYNSQDKIEVQEVSEYSISIEKIDADVIQGINLLSKPESEENIHQKIEFQFGILYALLKELNDSTKGSYFSSEFEIALDSLFKTMVRSEKEYRLTDMYKVLVNNKIQEEFLLDMDSNSKNTFKEDNMELVSKLYNNKELIEYLSSIIDKEIMFTINVEKQISICGVGDVSKLDDYAFLLAT